MLEAWWSKFHKTPVQNIKFSQTMFAFSLLSIYGLSARWSDAIYIRARCTDGTVVRQGVLCGGRDVVIRNCLSCGHRWQHDATAAAARAHLICIAARRSSGALAQTTHAQSERRTVIGCREVHVTKASTEWYVTGSEPRASVPVDCQT